MPEEYPRQIIYGIVWMPCKTKGCPGGKDWGVVADLTTWVEEFKPLKLLCSDCKKSHEYRSDDLRIDTLEKS
jgi:hypothetical protein